MLPHQAYSLGMKVGFWWWIEVVCGSIVNLVFSQRKAMCLMLCCCMNKTHCFSLPAGATRMNTIIDFVLRPYRGSHPQSLVSYGYRHCNAIGERHRLLARLNPSLMPTGLNWSNSLDKDYKFQRLEIKYSIIYIWPNIIDYIYIYIFKVWSQFGQVCKLRTANAFSANMLFSNRSESSVTICACDAKHLPLAFSLSLLWSEKQGEVVAGTEMLLACFRLGLCKIVLTSQNLNGGGGFMKMVSK